MNKFILAILILCQGTTSLAKEYCSSAKGPNEIGAFLTCQTSLSLTACGGLGGYMAGRVLTDRLRNSGLKYLDQKSQLRSRLIQEAFEIWQESAPRITADEYINKLNGQMTDLEKELKNFESIAAARGSDVVGEERQRLSVAFNDLNSRQKIDKNKKEYLKLKNLKQQAQLLATRHGDAAKIKPPLLIEGLDVRNTTFDRLPECDFKKSFENVVDKLISTVDTNGIGNFEKVVHAIEDSDALRKLPLPTEERNFVARQLMHQYKFEGGKVKSLLLEDAMKSAAKLSSKIPLLAGGAVSVGIFAAIEIASLPNTGCSTVSESFRNADPKNNCKSDPKKIDLRDLKFLAQSDDEKKRLMAQFPELCKHSSEMHNELLVQPEFTGLKCLRNSSGLTGLVATTKDNNVITDYTVTISNGLVSSTKITPQGSLPIIMRYNEDEELTGYDLQNEGHLKYLSVKDTVPPGLAPKAKIANQYRTKSMLFLPEMKECCASTDDAYASKCMSAFTMSQTSKADGINSDSAISPAIH